MIEFDSILKTRLCRYLNTDQLDNMTDSSGVSQAMQRLNSLHKALSSFLPLYIVEDEANLKRDYGNWNKGTFMFADVSGFTALSEKLMERAGNEGTEILTQVINDYFSTMLEVLAKSDGQLLKFAGDALLTFFPAQAGADELTKAVHAGLRMQRMMKERFQPIQHKDLKQWFGEDHDLELTMSIGISQGHLFEALVGNLAQRDHMIMGHLPGIAMAAEEVGVRDEVIIDEALANAYADYFDTKLLADGFYQVIDNFGDDLGDYEFTLPPRRRKSSFLFSFSDQDLMQDLNRELERVEVIARYVSSEIVNKLVVKGDHIESEHRLATVIFVHFTGFAELLEAWGHEHVDTVAAILSRYYGVMQRVIASHGGVLTRSDPYKLGSKLLITFGAPVAHPDDADRAVMTALEMNRQLEIFNNRLKAELPPEIQHLHPCIQQRIGINQGSVFAGEVGWKQRREYTVMGDDVNLAARLMAKADFGQVIINQNVWNRVNNYFETEALPPFAAKGKSALIHAYTVHSQTQTIARTSSTPFIGRERIMLSLNVALQQAMQEPHQPQIVALTGDIGVGKTRLAKELAYAAESSGFRVAWATCRSQNNRRATWATIVAQLLDLDQIDDDEIRLEMMEQRLEEVGLSTVTDVFKDLLFTSTSEPEQSRQSRRFSNRNSQVRKDIFSKISNPESIGYKDEAVQFRKNLLKQLDAGSSPYESLWNQLQLGTSLADALEVLLKLVMQDVPLLIVIDDLHKEHPRALNTLKRLLSKISNVPFVLLATYESRQTVDLEFQEKIEVPELSAEEAYLMTTAILNASELGNRLSDFIWDSTSGRALYIEALLYTLESGGQLFDEQGVIELLPDCDTELLPDSIRGLIMSRIDQLSSEAREMVRIAAVYEETFSVPMLQFATEISDATVTELVSQLVDQQIFEDIGGGAYHFQHGVTQQAVYDSLTRLQRQKLHLKIADYFNKQEGIEINVLQKVYHTLKAGMPSLAVDLLSKAAKRAEDASDIEQAVELYSKALEIFPGDTDLQGHLDRLQAQH